MDSSSVDVVAFGYVEKKIRLWLKIPFLFSVFLFVDHLFSVSVEFGFANESEF